MAVAVQTSVKTSDSEVKGSEGKVYWVTASAGATGGAWQLDDGDGDGTVRHSAVSPADSIVHCVFDPPIPFNTAIFADIPGTNITLTIGFI